MPTHANLTPYLPRRPSPEICGCGFCHHHPHPTPGLCRGEDLTAPEGRGGRSSLDFPPWSVGASGCPPPVPCDEKAVNAASAEEGARAIKTRVSPPEGSPGWVLSKSGVEKKPQAELTADPSAWTVLERGTERPCQSCGPPGPTASS